MRKLLTLRWIGFHALTLGSLVLFAILGHWQWDVGGTHRGTLRNYAYGAEWWIFGVILLVLWYRLIRQELRGDQAQPQESDAAAARPKSPRHRVPAPQVSVQIDEKADPELAAYNRYLQALHEKDTMKDAARDSAKRAAKTDKRAAREASEPVKTVHSSGAARDRD